MMEMSHHGALPIHRFCPLRTQVSPSRLAVVGMPPLVPAPARRQPFLLLLIGATQIERTHREAAVHAEERAERRVGARQLHRDEAEQLLAPARAAIALKAEPAEAEFLE